MERSAGPQSLQSNTFSSAIDTCIWNIFLVLKITIKWYCCEFKAWKLQDLLAIFWDFQGYLSILAHDPELQRGYTLLKSQKGQEVSDCHMKELGMLIWIFEWSPNPLLIPKRDYFKLWLLELSTK